MDTLKVYIENFFKLLNIDSDNDKIHFYKEYMSSAVMEFLDNEIKDEAYDVYSFFLDIYRVNISGDQSFIDLLDVLRKYEENASTLNDKQRDHYVHSVNVFLLGLAIYAQNKAYRESFASYLSDTNKSIRYFDTVHEEFFFRWGIASLFHDTGYPVEIINNQLNRFIAFISGKDEHAKAAAKPFLSYFDFNKINSIENFDQSKFIMPQYIEKAIEGESVSTKRLTDYIALDLSYTFGLPISRVRDTLNNFLATMQKYQFVDHGFYSALIVTKWFGELMQKKPKPNCLLFSHILDSAAAIFLHNAYVNVFMKEPFSFSPMLPEQHPIGFLLILCDETQEWNREAYGTLTRSMVNIDDSNITINDLEFKLHYITKQGVVNDKFTNQKVDFVNNLLNMESLFEKGLSVTATTLTEQYIYSLASTRDNLTPRLLIEHIELIASKIHERYNRKQLEDHPEKPLEYPDWESLPDTLKYSNVRQAKDIVGKLKEVNCYIAEYSDANQVLEFTQDEIEYLAKIEHDSWINERLNNGWVYGDSKNVELKTSPYIKPYEKLPEKIKDLDREPIKNIVPLLDEVNIKVYRGTCPDKGPNPKKSSY